MPPTAASRADAIRENPLSYLGQALLGRSLTQTSTTPAAASRDSSRGTALAAADGDDRIAQLLDMGFPPQWCNLALRATNNNGIHKLLCR